MKKKKHQSFTGLAVIVILFLYFLLTSVFGVLDELLFPSLLEIMKAFVESIPEFAVNLWSSLTLLVPGFGLALIIAMILGLLIGMNGTLKRTFQPIIFALNSVPPSVLTPYLIAIMPTFYFSSVSLIFIGAFFSILNGTINGISQIGQNHLDYARLLNLSQSKLISKIILPAAAPSILSGVKTALNFSFILLPIAEMFATTSGLGYFIQYNADFARYDKVIAGIIFMALFVALVMILFEKIKNNIIFWSLNRTY